MYLNIITVSRSKGIGNGLTYESNERVPVGSLVHVPMRSKLVEGIVINELAKLPKGDFTIKTVHRVLSAHPLLQPPLLKTMQWIAQYYQCTLRQALSVMLPAPPWGSIASLPETYYRIARHDQVRGKKQQLIMDALSARQEMGRQDILDETGASAATIRSLEEKGMIEKVQRSPAQKKTAIRLQPITLPSAWENICRSALQHDRPSLLLHTHDENPYDAYAWLAREMLMQEKSCILLFPELYEVAEAQTYLQKLIEQEHLHLMHGGSAKGSVSALVNLTARKAPTVVIGTRSALFAPVHNLGLVIIDKEHDWSYKNERAPCYHARLAAEVLCSHAKAILLLASATPSVESWHHEQTKRFALLRAPKKEIDHEARIINLHEVRFGTAYPFSPLVIDAIKKRIERNEVSVLFLNHKGIASGILCLECRQMLASQEGTPVAVHQKNGRQFLLDRATGELMPVPSHCPHCRSTRLQNIGAGTEYVASLAKKFFPAVRIRRVDSDSVASVSDLIKIKESVRNHEIDIIIGTQLALKFIREPDVTFAAALVADIGLSLPHIRAGEKTFQLLSELSSITAKKSGEAFIQTFNPQAKEIMLATKRQTEAYLMQECSLRKTYDEPPFTQHVTLITSGADAKFHALRIRDRIKALRHDGSVSAVPSLQKKDRWYVHIKGKNPRTLLPSLDLSHASIDIDPIGRV